MYESIIGVGAVILIGLWSSSLILCLLSLRTRHSIGPIIFVLTLIITIILLSIPRSTSEVKKPLNRLVDTLFVWRLTTLCVLSISSIIGLIALFSAYVMSQNIVPQIKSWIL